MGGHTTSFQYSIGDAKQRLRLVRAQQGVSFNTPLEMPQVARDAYRGGEVQTLSILHWRCVRRFKYAEVWLAPDFQYSIGDAQRRKTRLDCGRT